MTILDFYVNGTKRNEWVQRLSYSNGIEGNPAIEFEPADYSGKFNVSDKIQIYEGATKLLEGELKDLHSVYDAGIKGEACRIHVRDVKEKVFSYDMESLTGLENHEAMSILCAAGSVSFANDSAISSSNRFALNKSNDSINFFPMMQDIAASEGWGVWCDHDTLHLKDLINDVSNTYTITNPINVQHKYNDYNVYGNICINGMINRDRLASNDNPYTSVLSFNASAVVDSLSILVDNFADFLTAISARDDIIITEEDDNLHRFQWNAVNAASIGETILPDTLSISTDGTNFVLENFRQEKYNLSDSFGDQTGTVYCNGAVADNGASIYIKIDVAGRTPDTFTTCATPDNFLKLYIDSSAIPPADNRFLYYENYNFVNLNQMSILMESLKTECTQKILRLSCIVEDLHVFEPYDRIYINQGITDIDGYWRVYRVQTTRRADLQRSSLELVRSGVSIVPSLKIYNPPTLATNLDRRINDIYWKAIYLGNNAAYDLRRFKKRPIDLKGFNPRRGDMLNLKKRGKGDYVVEDVLPVYVKNADIVDDTTSTAFAIDTVTVTSNGDGTYDLVVKFNKPYDPKSIDKSNFVLV